MTSSCDGYTDHICSSHQNVTDLGSNESDMSAEMIEEEADLEEKMPSDLLNHPSGRGRRSDSEP